MPYTMGSGIKIHYQVEGKGPPLLLQHGGFGSMDDWYEYGYVEGLKEQFRLIMTDARAHGKSGKPYDIKQYSSELCAGDIVAVLDEIKVERCHFLGYSFGGRLAYWLERFYPDRLLSLMVVSMDSYYKDMQHVKNWAENMERWVSGIPNITEAHKARLLSNDREALALSASNPWPDDTDVLRSLDIPIQILCGEEDRDFEKIQRSARESHCIEFIPLPGFDHLDALVHSEVMVPLIREFFASVKH